MLIYIEFGIICDFLGLKVQTPDPPTGSAHDWHRETKEQG